MSCSLRSGDGFDINDDDVLSVGKHHYFCDASTSCAGYYVGVAKSADIVQPSGPKSDKWIGTGSGMWVKCDTAGFTDEWVTDNKIATCTSTQISAVAEKNTIVTTYTDYNSITPVIIKGSKITKTSVAVTSKKGYCFAYQCNNGKIANADRTQCINECTEGTEEPADCPSDFVNAKTCVKTCVSGKWKTQISECKDNTYSISQNRDYCSKQSPMDYKASRPMPDVTPAPQNPPTPPETTTPANTTVPVDAGQEQETTTPANTTAQQAETQSSTTTDTSTTPAASSGDCNSQENCKPSCVSGAESVQFTGRYCMAKECKPNFYKVKSASGVYQGWCIYKECPAGQRVDTDKDGMVLANAIKCVADTTTNTEAKVESPGDAPGDANAEAKVEASGDANAEKSAATETGETTSDPAPEKEAPAPAGPADGEDCHDEKANSTNATYMNGECVVHDCMDGYEKKSNNCVKISGPCKSLPAHAVRGHRKYNADTGDTECIIEDCDEGYVVADNKLSCHEDYDAQAEQAREREQSTGNKLVGALGMGATGIGGSMLMSGLAESNADDDAERAMAAYLETFTCKYGNESVSGGTMNVEIPGGNELINMYSEYVALANDLKLRKAALGMKPGIESEPILDSATSGLYDDVGTGRGKGAYASLARALENPDGEDAKAWAAQREESEKKTKTGAITAGVGAGASLIGNIAINGDKDNEDNDDDD